jgi:hypothetical protein
VEFGYEKFCLLPDFYENGVFQVFFFSIGGLAQAILGRQSRSPQTGAKEQP